MDDLFAAAGVELPGVKSGDEARVPGKAAPQNNFGAAAGVREQTEVQGVEAKKDESDAAPDSFIAPNGKPMTTAERKVLASPYGFAKYILGLPVYDGLQVQPTVARRCMGPGSVCHYEVEEGTNWQKKVFDLMDPRGARVSLRTANGSGKTSTIVAGLILWHLALFPHSLAISTAGVNRQVRSQLWPELERHASKFPGWEFNRGSLTITAPNGARYVGFTTDDAGKAEGWHGKDGEELVATDVVASLREAHKGPLLIIVDEAKSIDTTIFEAFDRCTYQRILYCSSPGPSEGEFYKSQTNPDYPFAKVVVPARLCPHADHLKNAETIRKRGVDHPLVQSAIFAQFASAGRDYVLNETDLARLTANPARFKPGTRAGFVDFAAGGDENVFAHRNGNKARIAKAWTEVNTMAACAEFVRLFRKEGYTPADAHEIMGDADGLGTPMLDKLAEMGWHLTRVRNGERADNAEDYFNKGTEIWLEAAAKIQRGEVIIEGLDQDDELRAQLLGRKQFMVIGGNRAGAMRVETKQDMQKRGVGSPDRADALLGCMLEPPSSTPESYQERDNSRGLIAEAADDYDDGRDDSIIAGAFCG